MSSSRKNVQAQWAERELFFWTAHQWIKLAVVAALAIYFIVSLATGHGPITQALTFWK